MRDAQSAADILGEHIGRQAVHGVVRKRNRLLLGLELYDNGYRTEDLFTNNLHISANIREDCGLDEVTRLACLGTTGLQLRAFFLSRLDEAENTLDQNVM